jgi:hypothetical protein
MTLENIKTIQTAIDIFTGFLGVTFIILLFTNTMKFLFHITMIIGLCIIMWFYFDNKKSSAIEEHLKTKEADIVNSIIWKKATGKLKLQLPNE